MWYTSEYERAFLFIPTVGIGFDAMGNFCVEATWMWLSVGFCFTGRGE